MRSRTCRKAFWSYASVLISVTTSQPRSPNSTWGKPKDSRDFGHVPLDLVIPIVADRPVADLSHQIAERLELAGYALHDKTSLGILHDPVEIVTAQESRFDPPSLIALLHQIAQLP